MNKWFKTNQGVGVIMAVLFSALLIYIQTSPWSHRKLRDGFSLGFFPSLAVGLLIVLSLILIFDSRRKQISDRLENLTFRYFLSTLLAVIFCFLYFKAMLAIGFVITTPVFLLLSIYALGIKSRRTLLTASFLITVIVYAIFYVMGIKLPPVPIANI